VFETVLVPNQKIISLDGYVTIPGVSVFKVAGAKPTMNWNSQKNSFLVELAFREFSKRGNENF
jgi:hypothetical protein